MRKTISVLIFLLILSMPGYADPVDDALAVLNKWSLAFAAADVDGIVKLYSPDALFLGTGSPSVVTQTEGIQEYFERALLNDRPRTARLKSYSALALSDSVVVFSGLDTITGTRNGKQMISNGRVTIVVAKREGEWKIVQFHRSRLPG